MDFRDELFNDDDNLALDDEVDFDFGDDDEISVPLGQVIDEDDFADTGKRSGGRFMGMTAGERAFLSVIIFLNVVVLAIGALMATGRLTF